MEQVVVNAASRLGFRVEQVRGGRAYAIEFGNEALVDSLPGVPGGSSFVGSFDREYAVEDETIDFFASGHALVEGLLAHFEEDPKGRVARLDVRIPGQPGAGLVAVYKDGPEFEVARLRHGRARAAGLGEAFRPAAAGGAEDEGGGWRRARLAPRWSPASLRSSEPASARRRGRHRPWLNSSRPPRTFSRCRCHLTTCEPAYAGRWAIRRKGPAPPRSLALMAA